MDSLLDTLAAIQPLIVIGSLLILWIAESFIPYLKPAPNRRHHGWQNLLLLVIAFATNGATGLMVNKAVAATSTHGWGLLNWLSLPPLVSLVAGMLLIDFYDYCYHVLTHKVGVLWRYHRVHHSDTTLDSTSSLRFHPFEFIMQALAWLVMIPLLGISAASLTIYLSLYVGLVVFQHANVRLPAWVDRYGSYIFSTPGWHKMHHAADQRLTDSHYGDVFTFWDRLFGTGGPIEFENLEYGLEHFRDANQQTVKQLLLMPFKPLRPEA